jgi:hypothetical protein
MCDGGSGNPSRPSNSGATKRCPCNPSLIKPSTKTGWKFDTPSGRWEKPGAQFWKDDLNAAQRKTGRSEFDRGCVGVTNSLACWGSEDFSKSDCYRTEAEALAAAKKKTCGKGETPRIFALRYWDSKKSQRKVGPDGKYPVDTSEVYKAKPGYVNFDFGYRQSDGSYVHANHSEPGMKVKISPTSKQFDNGYVGFNTVLYCVRCGCK